MRLSRNSVRILGFALLLAHVIPVSIGQCQHFELADTIDTGFGMRWPASHLHEDLAFSPDGKLVAACFFKKAVLISPQKADVNPSVRGFSVLSGSRPIKLVFAKDSGSLLAATGKPLWKWDIQTRQLEQIEVEVPLVSDIAWSPSEKTIAMAHFKRLSQDVHISLYEVAAGTVEEFASVTCLENYPSRRPSFNEIQFLPDGTKLVTDADYYGDDSGSVFRIQLWDIDSKKLLKQVAGRNSCCSPDGKLLAFEDCGPDGKIDQTVPRVRFLDIATLEILEPLPGESLNSPAAWSADGKWLAILGRDNGVVIWDVNEEKVVGQLPAQKSGILATAFSADGMRIATSYNDGKIRIWQTKK